MLVIWQQRSDFQELAPLLSSRHHATQPPPLATRHHAAPHPLPHHHPRQAHLA